MGDMEAEVLEKELWRDIASARACDLKISRMDSIEDFSY